MRAQQGCLTGTPDQMRDRLTARAKDWAAEHSEEDADMWLAESLAMLDAGVDYIRRRTGRDDPHGGDDAAIEAVAA
jgi:hypothetical protein